MIRLQYVHTTPTGSCQWTHLQVRRKSRNTESLSVIAPLESPQKNQLAVAFIDRCADRLSESSHQRMERVKSMSSGDNNVERYWRSTIPEAEWSKLGFSTLQSSEDGSNGGAGTLPKLGVGGNQFVVGEVLGEGGMGVVHRARQSGLDRDVAYKRLHPGHDEHHRNMLIQEALVTGVLQHPGIVPIHFLGLDEDDLPVLVMKEVEGVDWLSLIKEPLAHADVFEDLDPIEFHVRVLMRLCSAVQFAHERGVIHRDIKPENVLLGRHGEVVLLDWGLAAAVSEDMLDRVPAAAECRDVIGTPVYMAPEMARPRNQRIGRASDIYLLGASLYHALTGRPPHAEDSLERVLWSTQSEQPPPFPKHLPRGLTALVARALEPEISDRYDSADEFRREMARYLVKRSSFKWSTEASENLNRLLELEDRTLEGEVMTELTKVNRNLAEARFGFERALDIWAENSGARVGLKELLSFGVRTHIRHGDLAAADALLRQIEDPDPRLTEAVNRLRNRLAEEEKTRDQANRLLRELDPRVGFNERRKASVLVPLTWAGMLIALDLIVRSAGQLSPWVWIGQGVLTLLSVSLVASVGRSSFLSNRLNRRLTGGLHLALLGDLALRAGLLVQGFTPLESVPPVIACYGISVGMMAMLIDTRMVFGAGLYFLASLGAAQAPAQSLLIFAATVLITTLPLAISWRRQSTDLEASSENSDPT